MAKDPARAFNRDGSLDPDSVAALSRALAAADRAEFSYLEFRLAARKLIDRGIDPASAYESVFTTAETIGVSRDRLLESARTYLATLDAERANFDAALEKRLTDGMREDEARIAAADARIEELQAERERLERELRDAAERKRRLEGDLASVRERVTARGEAFAAAHAGMRAAVEGDLAQMERYSGESTRL